MAIMTEIAVSATRPAPSQSPASRASGLNRASNPSRAVCWIGGGSDAFAAAGSSGAVSEGGSTLGGWTPGAPSCGGRAPVEPEFSSPATGVPHSPQNRTPGASLVPQLPQKLMLPARYPSSTRRDSTDVACCRALGHGPRRVDQRRRATRRIMPSLPVVTTRPSRRSCVRVGWFGSGCASSGSSSTARI